MSKQEKGTKERSEGFASALTCSEKARLMIDLLGQIQSHRKANEEVEHKATFAVSALLIGLAAYVARGDYILDPTLRYGMTAFSVAMTGLTVAYLIRNGVRIRTQCQMIVRIEQALGLYEEGEFISRERVQARSNKPYKSATIYPLEAQRYGRGDWAQVLAPQLLMVIFAGMVAVAVVMFAEPVRQPKPAPPTAAVTVDPPAAEPP